MDALPSLPTTQYLSIALSGQELAFPVSRVREVCEYPAVTLVPTLPPCVLGVANLRGAVLPVIDLALKFGLPPRPTTRRTCLIVVEPAAAGGLTLGLRADQVETMLELTDDDLQPPPAFGLPVKLEFVKGLARREQRFLLVLNVDRVLDPAELLALELSTDAKASGPEAVPR